MVLSPRILPIETRYHGCRFRSRLEARWAVFFDSLGLRWEYEREGYDLGRQGKYLPDFWIPSLLQGCHVEIKYLMDDLEEDDKTRIFSKCMSLTLHADDPVLLLTGSPFPFDHLAILFAPDRLAPPDEMVERVYHTKLDNGSRWGWCWPASYLSGCTGCAEGLWIWRDATLHYPLRHRAGCTGTPHDTALLQQAFNHARQARFEHGETPRVIAFH
jgi:hypothetical protein